MAAIQSRDYYRLSPQEALRALNTKKTGLTPGEAAEKVAAMDRSHLPLPHKGLHPFTVYLQHYSRPLPLLLILSSVCAYALGSIPTAGTLLALALLNTTLTWLQKTPPKPLALSELLPQTATVVRKGDTLSMPIAEVVTGDIVYIEKGMVAPADMRLVEEEKLFVSETALTGQESPCRKSIQVISGHAPATMRPNTVLAGSSVISGHAIGVVYATGNDTELAASSKQHTHEPRQHTTSLQSVMHRMGKWAFLGVAGGSIVLVPAAFTLDIPREDAVLFAIGLVVALIPLGLPVIIHLILTHWATVFRRHKAAVTKLSAIDTLSTTSAILADMTGIITKNVWKVGHLSMGGRTYQISGGTLVGDDKEPLSSEEKQNIQLLCTAAILTNHTRRQDQQIPEGALAAAASSAGIHLQHVDKLYREIRTFVFDTARQRASSLRYFGDKKSQKPHLFVSGATAQVLERCSKIWDNGKTRLITPDDIARIRKESRQTAKKALHTLGIAYRIMPVSTKGSHLTSDTAEQELIWLGTISLANPLREHMANTIAAVQSARIKVSLVTDASPAVAKAQALEMGLVKNTKELSVVTGDALARLSNTQIMHLTQRGGTIFSHISTHDKLRLVTLAKQGGKIIAATGQGPIDAPMLSRADVGIALNTAAPASHSDITLLDNNFVTIVYCIKESRTLSENLTKVLRACMTRGTTLTATFIVGFVAMVLFDIPPALSLLPTLIVGLAIELLALTALGRDKPEQDPMQQHPHKSYQAVFTRSSLIDTTWTGLLIASLAYTNYILFFGRYDIPAGNVPASSLLHTKAATLSLLVIVLCLLAHYIQLRSSHGMFSKHQLHNRGFWVASVLALATTAAFMYCPWLADFFGTGPLAAVDWIYAAGATLLFIAVREWQRLSKKHSRKAVLDLHRTHRLRTKGA